MNNLSTDDLFSFLNCQCHLAALIAKKIMNEYEAHVKRASAERECDTTNQITNQLRP